MAVVVTTGESNHVEETDLSITNSKEIPLGDASDPTPDASLPAQAPSSSAATTKPSAPKGSGGNPPGTSKAPTLKESSNPTKSPTMPNQRPTSSPVIPTQPPVPSPTSLPVTPPTPPAPFPSGPTGPIALRDQVVLFLQQEYGVSFQDPNSPAVSSVNWLLSEGVDSVDHKMAQRFTLKVLDYSLLGEGTPASEGSWNANKWSTKHLDECEWKGVMCTMEGLVSELHLGGRSYRGTIPKEIRILQRSLEILDLSKNSISGAIPEDLFQLTGLKRVYLYHNNLTGAFSPSWALLQNLTHLHMSHNLISSSLPNDLRRMTNLRKFSYSCLNSWSFRPNLPGRSC